MRPENGIAGIDSSVTRDGFITRDLSSGADMVTVPRVIRATYRLQFNEQFRLKDAIALIPYLKDLGISHLYSSPLLRAVPHSQHGYDVCDFSSLNPEIGTESEFEAFIGALH